MWAADSREVSVKWQDFSGPRMGSSWRGKKKFVYSPPLLVPVSLFSETSVM